MKEKEEKIKGKTGREKGNINYKYIGKIEFKRQYPRRNSEFKQWRYLSFFFQYF